MKPNLKPERKSAPLTLVVEPSVMKKLTQLAKAHHVTRGQMVRYIIASFLSDDSKNIGVENGKFIGKRNDN